LRIADFKCALRIGSGKTDGNSFVKRHAVFYWLVGLAIAATAVALSFHFDDSISDFMAQHQSRAMRDFMRYVSLFGDWPSHVALGLLLLGIAWIRDSKKWMRIFLAMLIAMSIAGVTGHVIKRTIPRPRPSVKTEIHWGGSRFSSKYHSFPSGHVGASTAFFCTLFLANRRIGLACLPIPILIAFSRMYIGAHYLSDVVCAAILGVLCALLVTHFCLRPIEN
jgi:membrane-associated phospholipid phosphatase